MEPALKVKDLRHMRLCAHCNHVGDSRRMLQLADGPWHDRCVVETMNLGEILRLPKAEREKITIGAAGAPLMLKLMGARHLELATV